MWDSAGREKFKTLPPECYQSVQTIFICYDITNYETFESVKKYYEKSMKFAPHVLKVMLGLKADLEEKRVVPKEEA